MYQFKALEYLIKTQKALKSKNDKLENEINRSRRQTGPKNSKDFTLVGTSKAGGIDAGLRHFFINFYFGVFVQSVQSKQVYDGSYRTQTARGGPFKTLS